MQVGGASNAAEMAHPNPTEDDLTLEELLSQFDDDDHGLLPPPPPVPPTNSLEQFDYIEELDRLLLQHDDEAQRQSDGDPEPIVLPPPEEGAAVSSFGQEPMYEALWVDCEREGEEGPVMLLPPPDEYKDMDDGEAGPGTQQPQPPSLLLQALAAPTAFSRALQPREEADLDGAPLHSEFALAGESSKWGQEPAWDRGSHCLAQEPASSWPNEGGEVYYEGGQQQTQDALYQQEHWQRPQVQDHQAPESDILSDLSAFRADELQACIPGQVHFDPCSPSDSPYIRACFQLATASVGDADSGIESVSSLSPPDGEMSPVCSPPSSNCIAPSSSSPTKPCKLQSVSVLSTILSQEPEPTKSSTLLNSLLLNNNDTSAPPPNPVSTLSITEAEDSSIEAAIFALKVIAIDPNEMTLSKESSTAALTGTTEASLFPSHDGGGGGGDPTGLSFLHGDEVPIRSALQDEDTTPRLPVRRKRPASVVEDSWAQEPQGWTTKANFPQLQPIPYT